MSKLKGSRFGRDVSLSGMALAAPTNDQAGGVDAFVDNVMRSKGLMERKKELMNSANAIGNSALSKKIEEHFELVEKNIKAIYPAFVQTVKSQWDRGVPIDEAYRTGYARVNDSVIDAVERAKIAAPIGILKQAMKSPKVSL